MKNIHVEDSYNVWNTSDMDYIIRGKCFNEFYSYNPELALNRSYRSMHIEWWLHNIGYYITKPFCNIDWIKTINLRCKDVDLEEWQQNA